MEHQQQQKKSDDGIELSYVYFTSLNAFRAGYYEQELRILLGEEDAQRVIDNAHAAHDKHFRRVKDLSAQD
jgi:hypothetical protein